MNLALQLSRPDGVRCRRSARRPLQSGGQIKNSVKAHLRLLLLS